MESRSHRLLSLTGPLFAVLFVVVTVLQGEGPGGSASGEEVVAHYRDQTTTGLAAVFATPLLVLLLVLFVAHLRSVARERRVFTGAGPTLMMSGAVLWAGGALLGSMLGLGLLSAADERRPAAAETLNVLSEAAWLPFIGGVAVTLVGAGLTVLSSDFLPRWLGWTALVVGIVSLAGPGGFLGFFVAPLWLLVAGLLLSRSTVPVRDPHRVERRADRREGAEA